MLDFFKERKELWCGIKDGRYITSRVRSVAAIEIDMINYDEEIKKFSPSLEVDETEDAIYNSNIKDITDVVLDMLKEVKGND